MAFFPLYSNDIIGKIAKKKELFFLLISTVEAVTSFSSLF